ncbi:hypothetical protein BKK79_25770 [Cupriavidus sp. USMAA2-4]|uniref:hypothetical protein n=1 Tax=Cupriavidus sp. USMAA2-4 TaxID=876364 RepID=UPI0008A70192|nr:hypothetical protein [Cupriavidus sp. USMAA2-4]AOY95203.1 hypothetical protein BKK79_25770 [Cupriavidus sp. USMAA2-4]
MGTVKPAGAAQRTTLRAVVATYRGAVPAYTLIATPAMLQALCEPHLPARAVVDPRARAHREMLRGYVRDSRIALPGAVVVAVAGGRMRCEADHLYVLELEPEAGDRLIVLDGAERLAELARSPWGACQTYVSAVPWQGGVAREAAAAVACDGGMAAMLAQVRAAGTTPAVAAPPPGDDAGMAAAVRSAAARWANAARVWH